MRLERLSALLLATSALFGAACQSVGVTQAPLTLTCLQSLDDRCALDPLCVRHIDPAHSFESYCAGVRATAFFSISECSTRLDISTGEFDAASRSLEYLFSRQTGDLVAVVELGAGVPACLAGPSTVTLPGGPPCVSDAAGYACTMSDASAE
jgi:hypothetical protein